MFGLPLFRNMAQIMIFFLFMISFTLLSSTTPLTVTKVNRYLDLTTQLSIQTLAIRLKNGDEPNAHFLFALPQNMSEHLSYFEAQADAGILLNISDPSAPLTLENDLSYVQYQIALPDLQPQAPFTLRITLVFTHLIHPFPKSIKQGQSQIVRYFDNHFFFSPYPVQSQETQVKIPSTRIESFTEMFPTSLKGEIIRYGPYEDVEPFRSSSMVVHFENNAPFLTVRRLVKDYEISYWGNLAVEESHHLEHTGAQFIGKFSRYEFQRVRPPTAVEAITLRLPPSAADVYYRDEIGNISTSHVSTFPEGDVKLEISPRFVLFGGWQVKYYLGYNVPLSEVLSYDSLNSGPYVLNVSFSSAFLEPISIDEHTVRVILPEGASDINLHLPFKVDNISEDRIYTYLDTTGRPVIAIKKNNLVSLHNRYFQITYHFSILRLLLEPFLIVLAFFLFFVFMMLYVRIDLSIVPSREPTKSAKSDKFFDLVKRIRDLHKQSSEQHDNFLKLVSSVKKQNLNEVKNSKKTIDAKLKQILKDLSKVFDEAKPVDSSLASRFTEIDSREKSLASLRKEAGATDDAFFSNPKANKESFDQTRATEISRYRKLLDEIQQIIFDLTEE